jgi:hypothetical protein
LVRLSPGYCSLLFTEIAYPLPCPLLAGASPQSVGIREKSAIEKARDRYYDSLHVMKVALGAEDPTLTEQASSALDSARERVGDATHYMLSYVPGTAAHAGDTARDRYDDLSSRTMSALLNARSQTDRLLKRAGVKERGRLEQARDAMDDSLHDLWVLLGYEQPSLLHRLEQRWLPNTDALKSKLGFGREPAGLGERLSGKMAASIDAGGEATLQTAEAAAEALGAGGAGKHKGGLFSSLKERLVGA